MEFKTFQCSGTPAASIPAYPYKSDSLTSLVCHSRNMLPEFRMPSTTLTNSATYIYLKICTKVPKIFQKKRRKVTTGRYLSPGKIHG